MRKISFPTAQTILFLIAAMVTILTHFVPAGEFDRLSYDKSSDTFIRTSMGQSTELKANQETLDELDIKIPLEKFTVSGIKKPISIPNSFHKLEPKPQGFVAFIQAPIKGIIAAADIIFLVLIIGGLIGIMNLTKAFDAGITWLSKALEGREYWLIILVTSLVALGGTTFGLAEETLAFYPILIPVFIAARYDAMVGLASVFIGSSIGTMCSTTNPFSVIIASDAAGINWTTGLYGRFALLILTLIICISYIMRYANRVKRNPENSVTADQNAEINAHFAVDTQNQITLNGRLKLILLVFSLSFIVMIYGVSQLNWWFVEMTTTFLIAAIIIGFIGRVKESKFVDAFVKGAGELLGVAFIIGIARSVSILMDDGLISDTMLYYASGVTEGMNKGLFANVMLYLFSGLSFFVPSSSGLAVLTMPIMAPLADSVGVGRELVINAYQYGSGLFHFINPTGLILASLAVVKVGFDRWLKFILPLFVILVITTMVWMTVSAYL